MSFQHHNPFQRRVGFADDQKLGAAHRHPRKVSVHIQPRPNRLAGIKVVEQHAHALVQRQQRFVSRQRRFLDVQFPLPQHFYRQQILQKGEPRLTLLIHGNPFTNE